MRKNYNQNKPLIQSREAEKERRLSFKLKKEELYMTENIITSRKSDKAEASLWNSSKKGYFSPPTFNCYVWRYCISTNTNWL